MTSTVLARKYRPRSFEAMVGQGHVVLALANALTQQRLHHAYLFTGTRGVGKTTVSRILAKSLNCVGPDGQGGITAQPCGRCQPCLDIDAGRFVDYVELDAASNRGVEEISQLLDQAVYKPVVGRFKVYMIDEVHMLSTTAFNAMLKTLEEPPDYLKFVLATTDPQKVPVTVLSRCLQFNLRPMAQQTVHEHLQRVLSDEGVAFEPAALGLLARAARGSMRDGLSLTDQAIAYGGGALSEPVVRQMLGSVDRQHIVQLAQALASGDGRALVDTVDQVRRQGLSAAGALDDLALAWQQMALLRTVPDAIGPDDEAQAWRELAASFEPDEIQLYYSLALQGRQELALSPDEYAGLLMILLRCLAFRPARGGEPPGPKAEGPAARQPAGPIDTSRATPVVALRAPQPAHQSVGVPPQAAPAPAPAPAPAQAPSPVPSPVAPQRAAPAVPPRPVADRRDPPASVPVAPASRADDPRPEPPPWDDIPVDVSAGRDEPAWEDLPASPPSALAPDPLPAARPTPEPGGASTVVPVVPTTPLGDRWADLVARLQHQGLITALVRELAMQAECVGVQDDGPLSVWRLRVERESLRTDNQRDRLVLAIQKLLGGEVRIELEAGVGRDTPALREAAARASRQAAAEALIRQDAMVVRLLEQFPGARIVPGSITPLST